MKKRLTSMHRTFFIISLFIVTCLNAAESSTITKVSWRPEILVNGTVCLFNVQVAGDAQQLTGKWMGHELTFSPAAGGNWYALAGVAYEAKAGVYDLELQAV